MKICCEKNRVQRLMLSVICGAAVLLWLGSANVPAASPADSTASLEAFRLGEQIYREGILPSGEPLVGSAKGTSSVPGTTFACVSCHLRSGLGSFTDGIYTPPANGAKLFKPHRVYSSTTGGGPYWLRQMVSSRNKQHNPSSRPPYTDTSFADALRNGIDPAGRALNDVMPHFHFEDGGMKLLVSYIKTLSSEFSPGVSDNGIRFATIITDEVAPENRDALLIPLENYIRKRNLTDFSDPRVGMRSNFAVQGGSNLEISLARWILKGSPETWRSQLEEYNRKEPVFAILGGISSGEWRPMHQFCEENRIPCVFPLTPYPVISQSDWYTLYFTKGYYQEGEGAARFLNEKTELQGKPIVQFVRDTTEGRALSRGFSETWHDLEQTAPVTVILKEGETLTGELLQQKLIQKNPVVVILWDGPESLKILDKTAAMKRRPAMVLVSSSYLGRSMFTLNEEVRDFTYLTYPYGISQLPEENTPAWKIKTFNAEANSISSNRTSQQSYILTLILDMALQEMKGNYYRDYLLDAIGTIMALDVPLYDRLNFGPGQRYASRGCYIVQLSKNGLISKIGWSTQ